MQTIEHSMYNELIEGYSSAYVVTESIKLNVIERAKGIELRDCESIFLLIVSHYNKHPIIKSSTFMGEDKEDTQKLPYDGRQLKSKLCVTFEFDKLPDQVVFVIEKFLDFLDESMSTNNPQDNISQLDIAMDGEYQQTNLGYAAISVPDTEV